LREGRAAATNGGQELTRSQAALGASGVQLGFRENVRGQLRISNFRRNIRRPAVADANLAGLRIHDLRHTAVALWIAAGANPKEVSARVGHTSVSFTLDRYGHLFPGHDTRAARPPGRHAH
jgi:integrase